MIKIVRMLNDNNILRTRHLTSVSYYSTKPAVKTESKYDDQLKEFEKISNIAQKRRQKLPQKPPFLKNLLLGKFDTDILTYPELRKDDWEKLEKDLKHVQRFLEQPEIKDTHSFSKQLNKKLAAQKLLGLQSSQLIGGRDMSKTESFRILEVMGETNFKSNLISNETLGVHILTQFGSDYLKKKYLEPLINGEITAAFCVVEPLTNNLDKLKRTAVLSSDGKSWCLNGFKKSVLNGSSANIFIAVAHTDSIQSDTTEEQKFTIFVVERDFGAISTKQKKSLHPSFEISDIMFENTNIPDKNIIGDRGNAVPILTAIYPEHRLSVASVCSNLNKKLINNTVEHYIKTSKEPEVLYETDSVQINLGQIATSLYVMDSMIYLTTGLMDAYEKQDCELEALVTKVFAAEQSLLNTSKCLNLMGEDTVLEDHWCNDLHKEALLHSILNESSESLKIVLALLALRYVGQELNEIIRKLRNPLFHATFIVKQMWTNRKQVDDRPKLDLYLHHYLHPSLINASNNLEYSVLRLKYATEVLFSRYGQDIIYKHMELRRLGDVIIDVYGMTASVGRASRSYCIGLQHSDCEVVLANSFCSDAKERVKANVKKIVDGPNQTTDENYRDISKRLFKTKNYFPTHALTRNF